MNWIDFALGVGQLAIIPFVLAAYGGHLAAEALADARRRRNVKVNFWALCLVGILIAALYQYRAGQLDEQRLRKTEDAQRTALTAQADLRAAEKYNGDQIIALQRRVERAIANPQSSDQKSSALLMRKELAAEVAEKVQSEMSSHTPTVVAPQPPAQTMVAPPVTKPIPRACRGDELSSCDDEGLMIWGNGLLSRTNEIEVEYMSNLKALDSIQGGNWLSFVVGKDKDSKWIRAYSQAQHTAADHFRDCCAEDALRYHREMAGRVGGGLQKTELYDWVEQLLMPVSSSKWKKAREDAGKIIDITYELQRLHIELDAKIRQQKISVRSQP